MAGLIAEGRKFVSDDRTVRAALDGHAPGSGKAMPRRSAALAPVRHLIDAVISAGHRSEDIWARLMDEHDTSISYAVRD